MPAGRPVEYNDQVVKRATDYVNECEDKEEQVVTGESEKFTSYKNKLKVNLPTIEGLAVYLGIHKDTVYDWEKKYPEFSDVLHTLRAKQIRELFNKGLAGDYNPIIAKLLLNKHGYTEKSETKHSGEIANPSSLDVDKLSDQAIRELLNARRSQAAGDGTGEA